MDKYPLHYPLNAPNFWTILHTIASTEARCGLSLKAWLHWRKCECENDNLPWSLPLVSMCITRWILRFRLVCMYRNSVSDVMKSENNSYYFQVFWTFRHYHPFPQSPASPASASTTPSSIEATSPITSKTKPVAQHRVQIADLPKLETEPKL